MRMTGRQLKQLLVVSILLFITGACRMGTEIGNGNDADDTQDRPPTANPTVPGEDQENDTDMPTTQGTPVCPASVEVDPVTGEPIQPDEEDWEEDQDGDWLDEYMEENGINDDTEGSEDEDEDETACPE